jgi:urease gamma subunit
MRTTELDKTEIIAILRDMVLAHMSRGKTIEELADYLDKVVARRLKETHQ